jgi:hypothetical protein
MRTVYAEDILDPAEDSLEAVMGQIYTDIFNPALESRARTAFQALLRLFTRRLANTTNDMPATNKRFFYRMITHYLARNIPPDQITVVTFNQDLQIEKCLMLIRETSRWRSVADRVFNFPGCYAFDSDGVTFPRSWAEDRLFPQDDPRDDCLLVLKLHGSLNWYSTHTSQNVAPKAMFRPDRSVRITRRRTINTEMSFIGPKRKNSTLPVIVPPVTHKAGVMHTYLSQVWNEAEQRLAAADRVVIFGYSCPPLDFESRNLLRRTQRGSTSEICVVDPDPTCASRFAQILAPSRMYYYPTGRAYLEDC